MADETITDVSVADSGSVASSDAAASSTAQGATSPAQGTSSADVQTQSSDQTQQATEQDPLAGVPTLEELQGKDNVPYAKAVAQLRGAYEPLKTQFDELSTKFQPFESISDRFQTPEEVQNVVKLSDSLYKYSPDPQTGALVPDPKEFVEQITADDPERADYLAGQLIWGMTKDPVTGQPVQRAEILLHNIKADPVSRAKALQILGGVEPSQVPAPTWTPSQEELDKVDPSLHEQYKKLSYEERDELKLSSPDYINAQLRTRQLNEQLLAEKTDRENRDRQAFAQQEQQVEQQAAAAGDSYVEQGFKEGFTNFAKHIYETWQPTDNPEINKREGGLVALAVVALSHKDTRFAAEQVFKEMGVDPKDLEPLNKAREAYAQSGHEFGYLSHKKQRTNGDPARAQQSLIAQARALATKIIAGRDEYFKARATAHNQTLDQAATARPLIGGTPQTTGNGAGNRYLQAGKRSEADIWGT